MNLGSQIFRTLGNQLERFGRVGPQKPRPVSALRDAKRPPHHVPIYTFETLETASARATPVRKKTPGRGELAPLAIKSFADKIIPLIIDLYRIMRYRMNEVKKARECPGGRSVVPIGGECCNRGVVASRDTKAPSMMRVTAQTPSVKITASAGERGRAVRMVGSHHQYVRQHCSTDCRQIQSAAT